VAVTVFKFGDFKLDCDRFELYRAGRSLKLERKPMELLVLLATKNGHLVTRTEIAQRLWDKEVFVDTEHGINTAIRKIREVLDDDPAQSRFVQTVTGKGYRFTGSIAEVPPSSTEGQNPPPSAENRNRIGDIAPAPAMPPAKFPIPPGNAESLSDVKAQHSRNPRLRFWLAASAVLVLVAVIGAGSRSLRDRSRDRAAVPKIGSLAVLPLDNLSGDRSQDYFADGMTDELTTMLAKNSMLRVVSRTSVMQYKGVHRPLPEIARELGVDGILEGSVTRTGDKVHMTIQLIQASSDAHVWAESYDRSANDVVSLPREAAQTIAKKLNSAVLQSTPQRYVNPEAHDAYMHGRYLWFLADNEEAGKYLRKATELQPDYAPGWAGLSMYYAEGAFDGTIRPEDSLPRQAAAAVKAVELDDSFPEAHLAMGVAMFLKWNWAGADQEFDRAIELDPEFAEAYNYRSKLRVALNRNDEAIEAAKKAMEINPFETPSGLAHAYFSVRQYDAAINDANQRLEGLPQNASLHWALWEAYRRKGALKEAAQEWETRLQLRGYSDKAASIRRAVAEGGYKSLLREQLSSLGQRSATHYVSPVYLALLYAQLGQKEEALSLLEEGYRQRSPQLLWIQTDPAFDFLHADERYRSIIKRIGLPPIY
jgi:TolB-like protein/DNA-binding winged helix-turn-helix (wHTH) protein